MTVLPRDADENVHVVRFELVRRQIFFERFFGLEFFVELVAFGNQSVGVFCLRRSASEAKYGTKQPESAKKMIRIHEGKLSRKSLRCAPGHDLDREKPVNPDLLPARLLLIAIGPVYFWLAAS